jgi:hypothetical protein
MDCELTDKSRWYALNSSYIGGPPLDVRFVIVDATMR